MGKAKQLSTTDVEFYRNWTHAQLIAGLITAIREAQRANNALRALQQQAELSRLKTAERLCPHGYPPTVRCLRCGE